MEGAAKKKASKVRNPLEPLLTFNSILVRLLILGFGAAVVATVFGHGTVLGWGRKDFICVATNGMTAAADRAPWDLHLYAGVHAGSTGFQLCTEAPSAGQRWWYSLQNLPAITTVIVIALVTYLALRQAQQNGPYTPSFAAKLRFLGWFLLADAVIRPTVELYASHQLWATMTDGPMPIQWNPVWAFVFAGIALLSLARIMRVGSAMREDLEGVV